MNEDKYILKEDKDSLDEHLIDVQDNTEDKKAKEAILNREKEFSELGSLIFTTDQKFGDSVYRMTGILDTAIGLRWEVSPI